MNIESLIEVYRKDFTDDKANKNRWSDEFCLRSFSEAQKQACNRVDLLFDNSLYLILKNGRSTYLLPERLTRLVDLTMGGIAIRKVLPTQLKSDWRSQTGFSESTDKCYIIRGNQVTFVPAPDAVDDNLTVYVEGYVIPDDFVSMTQEPEIPIEYHKDLVHWVLYEGYSNDDKDAKDEIKSQTHFAEFNRRFGPPVSSSVRQHQLESNMR